MPIPCPHFKITIVKRSQGQSAVAGAAYQSGERLFSEYDQKTKFYNKKKELVHAEIMLPSHAPPGFADRATLIKGDVLSGVHQIHEKEVSIIFMDPPYTSGIEPALFRELRNMPYVTENTTIILEASIDRSFTFLEEFGFTIVREKNYKTNKHLFIKRQ